MAQRLISSLFLNWYNRPILVIGGGPSVGRDLPTLPAAFKPACVISANQHGYMQSRFPVDLVVNCDKKHCMERVPMGEFLNKYTLAYGGALVNKFSFADYRLGDWHFEGNSGMTAIVVAAALGGNPVVVTGIDMWDTGRTYFHDAKRAPSASRRRVRPAVHAGPAPIVLRKLHTLESVVHGGNIRPMSGPLLQVFPQYNPAEVLPAGRPTAYRTKHFGERESFQGFSYPFHFGGQDIVPTGTMLALTPAELALALHTDARLR